MNLDDCTTYVFVRNDLPLGQDDIQSDHACIHLGLVIAQRYSPQVPGIPWLITKEKLRTSSIKKLSDLCIEKDIAHYLMHDEHVDKENPTSLAILATNDLEKEFFRRYPLRNYSLVAQAHIGNGGEGANADLAQLREQPVSNGEVVGENPAVGSKHLNCS